MKRFLVAAAVLAALSAPALAQFTDAPRPMTPALGGQIGVTPPTAPTYIIQPAAAPASGGGIISLGPIFGNPQIDQMAQDIVNSLVLAAMGWIFWVIKNKLGVSIDKDQRDALTAAAQRQASSLVADGMVSLSGKTVKVDDKALFQAANALAKAAPDAIAHFGITDPEKLADRIVDMIPHVPTMAPAIAAANEGAAPLPPPPPKETPS